MTVVIRYDYPNMDLKKFLSPFENSNSHLQQHKQGGERHGEWKRNINTDKKIWIQLKITKIYTSRALLTSLHFFVTYEWAQQARVLQYTWPERLVTEKHTKLLGPFISNKENSVLRIWLLGLYLHHLIFFVTYEWAQQARVLQYTWPERVASEKHTKLLGPFISYKENRVLRL